ncbi:hypothetical protein HNP82_001394 [Catenibacillus scindens]|uniref:Uncharacterized protein n=1 Tax=Catenibacillus scindens TaxID=673271 RepID=A0A7W8H9M1_9FIRM|nr:hypothetical protein [Catenibacillus scindens]MBB5264283.1 hypothetical protein [Catenibacillus scindens]
MDDGYVRVEADEKFKKLLQTIFTDEFMQKYTNFDNFEGFQYSSAVITNWNADTMVYARLLMDNFVKESTQFQTWDEMVMKASDEKFGK